MTDAAQRLTDYARGITVNVGAFTGGTSKNTVPEKAECQLDMRYETVADAEALEIAERLRLGVARGAVHFVAAVEEQLREIRAVLPAHAEDDRLHRSSFTIACTRSRKV